MRTVLQHLPKVRATDSDDKVPAKQTVDTVRSGTLPVYAGRWTGNLCDTRRKYNARIP